MSIFFDTFCGFFEKCVYQKKRSEKEVTCLIAISKIDNAIQCVIIYHEISGHYGSKLKLQIKSLELHDIFCTQTVVPHFKVLLFQLLNFQLLNF